MEIQPYRWADSIFLFSHLMPFLPSVFIAFLSLLKASVLGHLILSNEQMEFLRIIAQDSRRLQGLIPETP